MTKRLGMARKQYTAEESIGHLRTLEIETGTGLGIAEAGRKLGVTGQIDSRWKVRKRRVAGRSAKRLKRLDQTNVCLQRLVVD